MNELAKHMVGSPPKQSDFRKLERAHSMNELARVHGGKAAKRSPEGEEMRKTTERWTMNELAQIHGSKAAETSLFS